MCGTRRMVTPTRYRVGIVMGVCGVRKSCERWREDISLARCKFCDGKPSSSSKFDDYQECGP